MSWDICKSRKQRNNLGISQKLYNVYPISHNGAIKAVLRDRQDSLGVYNDLLQAKVIIRATVTLSRVDLGKVATRGMRK